MRMIRCRQVATLPSLQPAEEVVAAAAAVDGRLAVLAALRVADYSGAGRVYVHDGDLAWWPIQLIGPAVALALLDLLPGGEILVVEPRSQRFRDGSVEDNAHVFDPAGGHLRSFCLGDGIERIGVDAAGTIWVGYFDEGVFGNLGWDDPIGAAGLVRFDHHGRRLWTYQPPSGADEIVDCYALNVDARTTLAYYHSDFPLVEVSDGRARAYAPTPVRGARHVLACRDEVVFVGEYDDPLRLADCRRTSHAVDYLGQAVLHDVDGTPLHLYRPIAARGSRLWLRTDDRILLADLADNDNRRRT